MDEIHDAAAGDQYLASCRVILKDMRLPMIQRAISPEAMEKRTLPARKGWSSWRIICWQYWLCPRKTNIKIGDQMERQPL